MKTAIKSAALALCLLLAAAAPAQQDGKKSYKVGAAVSGLRAGFMQLWVNALKEHPAVKDGSVALTVFDAKFDAATQNGQMQTMIEQKYDGILFVPVDTQAGADAVAKAAAAAIPVVGSNARVNSDKLLSYVGSNDVVAGEMQAEFVLQSMGSKGNVVILEGQTGQSAQVERSKGNKSVLARYPQVKLLEIKSANWSRSEAKALTGSWLAAHAGKINGIIGQNDEMALGAIEALKAKGIDPKTIPVAGVDGVSDALRAIKAGHMVSMLQDASAQSQGALDVLLRKLIGPGYKPRAALWAQYDRMGLKWQDGSAKAYSIPWSPITAQNIDALLEQRK